MAALREASQNLWHFKTRFEPEPVKNARTQLVQEHASLL